MFDKKIVYGISIHIFIMINTSSEGICVSFEEKTTQHWLNLLNIIFDYLSIKLFKLK